MITNLIATVVLSVVTNVATTDNGTPAVSWGIPPYGGYFSYGDGKQTPMFPNRELVAAQPATERTETTTVDEVTTLRFTWKGEAVERTTRRTLSTTARHWQKRVTERWEETPAPALTGYATTTWTNMVQNVVLATNVWRLR